MKKIMVIGVGPGVGKSTFSRRISELTDIKVTHLDRLYWGPCWIENPYEEFVDAQEQVVQEEKWIIEGNYASTFNIRERHAETIIYLELPLWICLYRVLKRRVQYHGRTRDDMGEGCEEKMDWAFLKFILTTYRPRKKNMIKRLQCYVNEGKTVHYLKTTAQIEGFLTTYIRN